MSEARRQQEESELLLEQFRETDRSYARRRKESGQALSEYDREILGIHDEPRRSEEELEIASALTPVGITWQSSFLRDLNRHAVAVCMEHHIRVVRCADDGEACAAQEARTIYCPPVTSEASYAIALHELAHLRESLFLPRTTRRSRGHGRTPCCTWCREPF